MYYITTNALNAIDLSLLKLGQTPQPPHRNRFSIKMVWKWPNNKWIIYLFLTYHYNVLYWHSSENQCEILRIKLFFVLLINLAYYSIYVFEQSFTKYSNIFFYSEIILLLSINNVYLNIDKDHVVHKEVSW